MPKLTTQQVLDTHLDTDRHVPSFVVLADPEGNRACLCTCLDR